MLTYKNINHANETETYWNKVKLYTVVNQREIQQRKFTNIWPYKLHNT